MGRTNYIRGSTTWELVSVVDVAGREIGTIMNGNQILFDEPSGIYFITVAVNGAHSVHKVLSAK